MLALALLDAGRKDLDNAATSCRWAASVALASGALAASPPNAPARTPPTITAYTAPDRATHLAALTTWDTRRSAYHRRPQQLPPWVPLEAAPETNPAAPERWESIPLARFSTRTGRDGWLAWAGVVMAVALLLIAVLA
jgi:hypothetical protein